MLSLTDGERREMIREMTTPGDRFSWRTAESAAQAASPGRISDCYISSLTANHLNQSVVAASRAYPTHRAANQGLSGS
ncbi:uncharacterized protein CLUP02_16029 [Colletotrichum lupini]|uniref:Uncharacterized protein n=1 Tax=Colletotrichum lupini TaxID=145971 RepID=A0A9Q8T766_9PEZI|nr:uncharacterized protein CLUP02_16029 [Colletotrichum lupini]UQC90499.1 hypothetical protein CLUP02_16029 [Colletotrichum lupini]